MIRKVLPLLTLLLISSACFGQKSELLGSKDFKKIIEETKDIQLIDVRTKDEFVEGHIKNSVMIDFYRKDFKEVMNKLDKDKPIAVYCTIAGRSGVAARMLVQLGFKEIYDLKGGIIDWQKDGYKLTKD